MKKWIWVLVVVVLLILIGCSKKEGESADRDEIQGIAPVAQMINDKIESAIRSFESGEAGQGALLILDAVAMTGPAESYPEGFTETLEKAREAFENEDFQNGVKAVYQARQIYLATYASELHGEFGLPSQIEEPDEETSVAPIALMMKEKVESARSKFIEGEMKKGVIFLLEAIEYLAPVPSVPE